MVGLAPWVALAALASAQFVAPTPSHPVRIRGVVIDDVGTPLGGVDVKCGNMENSIHPYRSGAQARTDAKGHFSCGPIEGGAVALRVNDGRGAHVIFDAAIDSRKRQKVILTRRAVVHLRVSFGDGGARVGGAVPLLADGGAVPGDDTVDAIPDYTLDIDGGWLEAQLAPSTKLLRVRGDFVPRDFPLDLKPGRRVELGRVLVERAGSVDGLVRRAGAPAAARVCAVLAGDHAPASEPEHCATSSADGHFRIESLAPGRYQVSTYRRAALVQRVVDVAPGESAQVELDQP